MTFDQRAFRNALGRFATGITVVTTRAADGRPLGITVNSFTSVSLDPPLVLFCLDRGTQSLPAFVARRRFAVNVLAEDQRDLSVRFAMTLGDRWDGVSWRPGAHGCPILDGSLARFECAVEAIHEGGDHLILVGRVDGFGHRPGRPLLFYAGDYLGIGGPA